MRLRSPSQVTHHPPGPLSEAEHWANWGAASSGARIVITRHQRLVLLLVVGIVPLLLVIDLRPVLIGFLALITLLYFVTGVYKVALLLRGERALSAQSGGVNETTEAALPLYTVLVPLHHESKILPVLLDRLASIDYPPTRLEVLLLVELDDEETQAAIGRCRLPPHIRPMTMPPGQPRTKPRALNVGLSRAHGEYIVIYDAEDYPEPDQLRKAVALFRTLPEQVVCVQAGLNFYNRYQSLLTRLFAVDYAGWYNQLLPGLAYGGPSRSGAFLPLGGTSNHFRVSVLRQMGGWDPFNVTEDCDLGVRIGRAGMRVAMLDSVTWEEAVPRVKPWMRQRSRWVKGYLQTYLVHMRQPLRLWRQLGTRGFVDFQMLVGASSFELIINPLMWGLTVLYIAGSGTPVDSFIQSLFPTALYYPALLTFTAGNFIFFYCNAYVCVRHAYIDLCRYALLTPFYWLLMSAGAWMGLYSLVTRPYYWAKTEHGVSLSAAELHLVTAGNSEPVNRQSGA